MSYWVNFAMRGDPNGSGLPPWPAYDEKDVVQILGAKITLSDLHIFVDGLDPKFVDAETKQRMKDITPDTYVGLAPSLDRKSVV